MLAICCVQVIHSLGPRLHSTGQIFHRTLCSYGTVQYFGYVHTELWAVVPCERNTLTYEFSTGPVRSLVVAYKKNVWNVRREPDVSFNTTDTRKCFSQHACCSFLRLSVDFCGFLHKLKPEIRSFYTDHTDEVVPGWNQSNSLSFLCGHVVTL